MSAQVVALFLNKASRAPLEVVPRVLALAGQGLEGDRHAKPDARRSVLLMQQEVLDEFGLEPGDVREQVTVRGLDLMGLVFGSRLRVGDAVFEVAGPCAPCERMNELQPGLREKIDGRRGRFVHVVQQGSFAVGDPVVVETPVTLTERTRGRSKIRPLRELARHAALAARLLLRRIFPKLI